jgi:hypothetical protein
VTAFHLWRWDAVDAQLQTLHEGQGGPKALRCQPVFWIFVKPFSSNLVKGGEIRVWGSMGFATKEQSMSCTPP